MLAGPSGATRIDAHAAWSRGGHDAYSAAAAATSSVDELHAELCALLGGVRFHDAVRTAVQHTFRAAAAHIYEGFPASGSAGGAGGCARDEPAAAAAPAGARDKHGLGTVPSLSCIHSHGTNAGGAGGGGGGSAAGALSKPARPLARVLRTVQASGDALFEGIKSITKGIAALPAVMALSATAFATNSQLGV
eukprot:356121-Chlamydomonas_euryale.AAC.1